MIELYAAGTTNGFRTKIMLEECGFEYDLHLIDLAAGEHNQTEFLKLNPLGLTPVIVDHSGPNDASITLTQSVAILIYLANKAGRFIPTAPDVMPKFWERLIHAASDIAPTVNVIFTIERSDDAHAPTLSIFNSRFNKFLHYWDKTFEQESYCVGEEVSIVDFAMYGVLARYMQVSIGLINGFPNVQRWASLVGDRPSVQAGVDF